MADGNITGALITGAGLWDQLDRYDEMKNQMQTGYEDLSNDLYNRTDFTGFTTTGYGGSGSVDGDGNVNIALDPTQQAMADNLTAGAGMFYDRAQGDYSDYQNDVYNSIRAMQQPEEERAYHSLEGRLAAQGRLGAASDMYGSSPEMLSYNKAVQEAQNAAAFKSYGMGMQQQAQDANLGSIFQQNAFLPQAQMQNLLNSGFNAGQLNQAGQLAGAGFGAQLGSDAMRGGINAEKIRADIMLGLFNTAGNAFSSNNFDPVQEGFQWGWDKLFGEDGFF